MKKLLKSDLNTHIDSIIDKTDNILSAVPTSDIKDTIDRINVVLNNDTYNGHVFVEN